MAYLKGFGLENFRVFKEYTWFDFAPITVLVGPNNSGKSSLIKALLLLKDNFQDLSQLDFTAGDHDLISFNHVVCKNRSGDNIDTIFFTVPIVNSESHLILEYKKSKFYEDVNLFRFSIANVDKNLERKVENTFETSSLPKEYINLIRHIKETHYLPTRKKDDFIQKELKYGEVSYSTSFDFFKKWANCFGFRPKIKRDTRTNQIYVEVDDKELNDLGTGIRQIFYLLLFVLNRAPRTYEEWDTIKEEGGELLVLEEPEANLHPKFQSLLADMIVEANKKLGFQFIIETHSEYLIRKLQYLTAKEELKSADIVIHYFNDLNNVPLDDEQIKRITIFEDGSLSEDFGPGFYDEAANWELELLKLKRNKSRQN